jgi:hypothetical protein
MNAAIWSVAGTAVVLSIAAVVAYGARAGLGVAIGGAIATANLVVFARIGQAFIGRRGNTAPWAVIAVVKLIALLGGVWLIMRSGVVSGLALTIGYGSLPIGITLGSLFGPKPPETMPAGGTVKRRPGDVLEAKPAAGGAGLPAEPPSDNEHSKPAQ